MFSGVEVTVEIVDKDMISKDVYPLHHHIKHSPSGFEWGYNGSGPTELARCILADHFNNDIEKIDRSQDMYIKFRNEVIASMIYPAWIMDSNFLSEWMRSNFVIVKKGEEVAECQNTQGEGGDK